MCRNIKLFKIPGIFILTIHPPIIDIYDFYLYRLIELIKRFKIALLSSTYLKAK